MITIKELSAKCGLSISAVSKALNNYPDISAETRSMVLRTARDMGYIPNAVARALKTNRSYNIGVLLDDDKHRGLLHRFFVSVLENFKSETERRGYDITLINHNVGERIISYVDHCHYRNLDGVFIACMDFHDPGVSELAVSDIPLVTVDHLYDGCAAVFSDNHGGLEMLVRHAAKKGHKKIAYIHGTPSTVTDNRLSGYHKALGDLGLSAPAEYRMAGRYRDTDMTYALTKRMLELPDPPSCIIMPDDLSALGGISAIRDAGMRVPDDVSIAGYDGLDLMTYDFPVITTVMQNTESMGRFAADLLLSQIEQRPRTHSEQTVLVPVTLISGETVAPIAGSYPSM